MQLQKSGQGYKLVKLTFRTCEIPEEWEVSRFGDISTVKRGASPRPIGDPTYFGTGRGWIRISDVTRSHKYLTKTDDYLSELGESKSVPVNEGDLIISIAATVGKPIILKMKACIHDGFVTFSNLSKSIDVEFLYYLLTLMESRFGHLGQHGTQSNINTQLVSSATFPKPPLAEQQKIASILSKVDELIQKTDQIIEQIQRLKKGLMHRLLTKGIGHTEFRLVQFYPRPIKERIPPNWRTDILENILSKKLQNGITIESSHYGKGCPIVEIDALYQSNMVLLQKNFRMVTLNSNDLNNYRLMDKDFLINRVTKLKDGAGKLVLVKNPIKDLTYEGNLIRFRINEDLIIPEFFEYYSKSRLYFNYMQSTCKTLSLTSIDQDVISKIPVILPPKHEQKEIVNVLSSIDLYIQEEQKYRFNVVRLKKGLMEKLLAGKIRVKV